MPFKMIKIKKVEITDNENKKSVRHKRCRVKRKCKGFIQHSKEVLM